MKKLFIIIGILVLLIGAIYVLTQTKPTITKTAQVTLTVLPRPDFNLEVTPSHIDAYVGRSDGAAYNASVTSVNGFAGVVNFSVSGLPSGFTITYFPSNQLTLGTGETRGIQINAAIADNDSLIDTYTITVKAESTNYN